MTKIKEKLKKSVKLITFLIVFICVCFIYNQNFQTLNYFLKRGTILEYSMPDSAEINKDGIKNKLIDLKIKYSFTEVVEKKQIKEYDFDNEKIDKSLYIGLALLSDEKNIETFNSISDYLFENYKNSKLIELRPIENIYSTPWLGFLKFLGILCFSFFFWLILYYLFCDKSQFYSKIKNKIKEILNNQKENIKNFVKNTKEKGFGYFIKKLLFDEDEKEDVNFTKEIISTIFFVLICVIVIRYFIGELRWIPSGSMRPTIIEHDRVFVEKLDFPKKEIKRGDILVFYPPKTELSSSFFAVLSRLSGIYCRDIAYIKRVIGMPNDKLEIKKNDKTDEYRVYINDKPLNEPYIKSRKDWTSCSDKNVNCGPFIIPSDSYFMMGDNRDNSQDSRYWGFLEKNRVIGRANFMFFPLHRINTLKDKYLYLHEKIENNNIISRDYILNRYEFLYKI